MKPCLSDFTLDWLESFHDCIIVHKISLETPFQSATGIIPLKAFCDSDEIDEKWNAGTNACN